MEVVNNFKMYLPSEYINTNFQYNLDNNYILVKTNYNCYVQYNTTYCDCYRVYSNYNYIKSDNYSCSLGGYTTSSSSFSSDIFNLPNLSNYFLVYFIIVVFCIYILNKMWGIFRKRVK